MKKNELIKEVSKSAGISLMQATSALDTIMVVIRQELIGGGAVRLAGIGTISTVPTKKRMGRNPKTGEAMEIPPGRKVRFSVAKELKNTLNG
ncbi:HU family DNA-binding protein [Pseudodesulfovibrio pelocollis]|uniref:HU family DNA-binding protein n=1 Tax=Pseudodesulfovibrio pelocollis TaxID=3051432 RepID=UPI00255A8CD2|nr:HU family DNA-binding protein [Pseudodesulfovibrio sp. SB368]